MSYRSFTFSSVRERFGLTVMQSQGRYGALPPVTPSHWLTQTLSLHRPLVAGKASDKARAELLTAPILVEVREQLRRQIALFSGVPFDVNRKAGLCGRCDFLICRDPLLLDISEPTVVVSEAVREDLNDGTPACIAVMVAAQRFNHRDGRGLSPIYGAVTSGTRWRFLQLEGTTVTLDLREYPITELPQILGILVHMAS
jgi:hypothetical protein